MLESLDQHRTTHSAQRSQQTSRLRAQHSIQVLLGMPLSRVSSPGRLLSPTHVTPQQGPVHRPPSVAVLCLSDSHALVEGLGDGEERLKP